MLPHGECAELLALSALHALAPDEEFEVQGHTGTCPECREEFTRYLEVVGHLALTAGPIAPPADAPKHLRSAAEERSRSG
jgi:anti-sigma factor RsiW